MFHYGQSRRARRVTSLSRQRNLRFRQTPFLALKRALRTFRRVFQARRRCPHAMVAVVPRVTLFAFCKATWASITSSNTAVRWQLRRGEGTRSNNTWLVQFTILSLLATDNQTINNNNTATLLVETRRGNGFVGIQFVFLL